MALRKRKRFFVYSFGLFFNPALRRLLRAHGVRVVTGLPTHPDDMVAVWGQKPVAARGRWIAKLFGRPLVTLEDAFLRSVFPGRSGEPPIGLICDIGGIYFDAKSDSDLQSLIDDAADETKNLDLFRALGLSKYNDHNDDLPNDLPERFVLLIDQVVGDVSVPGASAGPRDFDRMVAEMAELFPDMPLVIKVHPEVISGMREGYLQTKGNQNAFVLSQNVSPWKVFERAEAVASVSSLLGFEAIIAGHKPYLFGQAFYAGRGLTHDRFEQPLSRRAAGVESVFNAAYENYAIYGDPVSGRALDLRSAMYLLSARARHNDLPKRFVFGELRLWKRAFFRRYFGKAACSFHNDLEKAVRDARHQKAALGIWASKLPSGERPKFAQQDVYAIEDGFIRSKGLGAELVQPVSLAVDRTGIYYDATRPSDLEGMIEASVDLPEPCVLRAQELRARLIALGVTKYNLDVSTDVNLPTGKKVVLVPEQVGDDASLTFGCSKVRTNAELVRQARKAFPDAFILYKRHPDVVAGLRDAGAADLSLADKVIECGDPAKLLERVDGVATTTSLLGFEALLRGVPVTCFGAPFYAGWGLTDDRGDVPKRRQARPSLDRLVHAVLIDYPLYWDPVTGAPCAPEFVLDRFEDGQYGHKGGVFNRALSKAQGALASFAPFWR